MPKVLPVDVTGGPDAAIMLALEEQAAEQVSFAPHQKVTAISSLSAKARFAAAIAGGSLLDFAERHGHGTYST
jgi:hypothetical protein